jgi:hypothetical protein
VLRCDIEKINDNKLPMYQQRPFLLLVLITFMLSPSIIGWAINPQPIWYKPYLLWAVVVLAAYFIQRHKKSS